MQKHIFSMFHEILAAAGKTADDFVADAIAMGGIVMTWIANIDGAESLDEKPRYIEVPDTELGRKARRAKIERSLSLCPGGSSLDGIQSAHRRTQRRQGSLVANTFASAR